jgi:hypothetical protein
MSEVYLVERNHYGERIRAAEVFTDKATAQSFADAVNEYLKIIYPTYTDAIANRVVAMPSIEGPKEYEMLLTAPVVHSPQRLIESGSEPDEYYLATPGYQLVEKGTPVPKPEVQNPADYTTSGGIVSWPYWSVTLHGHSMDELTELAQPYIDKFNATL